MAGKMSLMSQFPSSMRACCVAAQGRGRGGALACLHRDWAACEGAALPRRCPEPRAQRPAPSAPEQVRQRAQQQRLGEAGKVTRSWSTGGGAPS